VSLGRPTLLEKALSFTHELSFFFYQSKVLSSCAVDGHQMYFRGLVIGKASTISIEISPTLPQFSSGVKKCEIWRHFQHHLTMKSPRLKMQRDIRTLKQTSSVGMIAVCPRQVW